MTRCDHCGSPLYQLAEPKRAARPPLSSPASVFEALRRSGLIRARQERLVVIHLDAGCAAIGRPQEIARGQLNTCNAHPREIFREAVRRGAFGIVLAHNHPSGRTEPSDEDIEMTRAVAEAGKMIGITVYDHLIVSRHGFASLRDRGLL